MASGRLAGVTWTSLTTAGSSRRVLTASHGWGSEKLRCKITTWPRGSSGCTGSNASSTGTGRSYMIIRPPWSSRRRRRSSARSSAGSGSSTRRTRRRPRTRTTRSARRASSTPSSTRTPSGRGASRTSARTGPRRGGRTRSPPRARTNGGPTCFNVTSSRTSSGIAQVVKGDLQVSVLKIRLKCIAQRLIVRRASASTGLLQTLVNQGDTPRDTRLSESPRRPAGSLASSS